MFGHNDNANDSAHANGDVTEPQHDAVLGENTFTPTDASAPAADDAVVNADITADSDSPAYSADPAPVVTADASGHVEAETPAPSPASDTPVVSSPDLVESGANDDLINIKQSALKQLSPLVGHLNQTPEEKFRTTMMMIQASDDQSLIKDAYEAAQNIADEKTKAQALLDIVNEINYFTQHS